MSTPSTQHLVSEINQCLEKWLIPGPGQGKYKVSLGHFMVLGSNELLENLSKGHRCWLEGDCFALAKFETN